MCNDAEELSLDLTAISEFLMAVLVMDIHKQMWTLEIQRFFGYKGKVISHTV